VFDGCPFHQLPVKQSRWDKTSLFVRANVHQWVLSTKGLPLLFSLLVFTQFQGCFVPLTRNAPLSKL
jgi:hypothetical protein